VERRTKEIKTKTALIPCGGEARKTKQLSYLSVERKKPAAISTKTPPLPSTAKAAPCSAHTIPWYVEYHAPP
jgi:hypothetical protein